MALFSGLGGGLAAAAGGYGRGQVLGEERGYKRLQSEEDRAYKKELLRLKKEEVKKDPKEPMRAFSRSEVARLQGIVTDPKRQQYFKTPEGAKELEQHRKALVFHYGVGYEQIDPTEAHQPLLAGIYDEEEGPPGPPPEVAARTQALRAVPFLQQPGTQPPSSLEMLVGARGAQPGAPEPLAAAREAPMPDVWQTTPPVWPWGQQPPPPTPLPRGDGISVGLPPGQGMEIPLGAAGPPLPTRLGPPDISAQLRPKPKLAPPPTAAQMYEAALRKPYKFVPQAGEYPEAAAERRVREQAEWRQGLEALRQAKVEEEASPGRRAEGKISGAKAGRIGKTLDEEARGRQAAAFSAEQAGLTAQQLRPGRKKETEERGKAIPRREAREEEKFTEQKRKTAEAERMARLKREDLRAYRKLLIDKGNRVLKQKYDTAEAKALQTRISTNLRLITATKGIEDEQQFSNPRRMRAQTEMEDDLTSLSELSKAKPPSKGGGGGEVRKNVDGKMMTFSEWLAAGKKANKDPVALKRMWAGAK